jgi:hypothetical protein
MGSFGGCVHGGTISARCLRVNPQCRYIRHAELVQPAGALIWINHASRKVWQICLVATLSDGEAPMMGYGMMYGYGPFHWLWFIIVVAVVLYPIGRILNRIGFSPLWSVLAFVPILNLVALWVLAFTDWPARRAE